MTNSRATYSPLLAEREVVPEDWRAEEFKKARQKSAEDIPYKSILLGIVLLVIGIIFFIVCYAHHHGHTKNHIKEGSGWGLAIMGTVTFLPGAYACWVAFAAWKGILGYRFSDLPKMD